MIEYILHLLILVNIYIILVSAASFLNGFANLFSLAHAAFYGIGSYLAVFFAIKAGTPLPIGIICVLVLSGTIAFLFSKMITRLDGDPYVLATLGLQAVTYTLLYNWTELTNGPYGISGIPSPVIWSDILVDSALAYFILTSILSVATIIVFRHLIHSPFGRIVRAFRDDQIGLLSIGRDIKKIKVRVFVICSSVMSLAGVIYAHYMSFIDPTSFSLEESFFILAGALIGGSGNVTGPIFGALFIVVFPEILRFIGLPDSFAANVRQIIFGVFIIFVARKRPSGIFGRYSIK